MIKPYQIKNWFYIQYWKFIKKLWDVIPKQKGGVLTNTNYSIGIATYVSRYEGFLIPLVMNLTSLYPDTQILITANGYYDLNKQKEYLRKINGFLANYPNVKLIGFEEPQSLSKLWNLMILNSMSEKIIILNDDVEISPCFRRDIEKSELMKVDFSLINRSWSHYLISKVVIKNIGWFDERFPELGNEDEDYESRMAFKNMPVKDVKIASVLNVIFLSTDFSYSESFEVINTKYAKANKLFFDSKWEISEVKLDGYVHVDILKKFVKLKPGMDTPNFYPNDL